MWLDMMLCQVFSLSLLLVSLHIFYRERGGGATSACPVGCPARTHAHSDACALREPSGSVRPEQHPGRRYHEKGKDSKGVKNSKHQTESPMVQRVSNNQKEVMLQKVRICTPSQLG